MARKSVQTCRLCKERVPLADTIWMDRDGTLHHEDGNGAPYCVSCAATVEHDAMLRLERVRKRQDRIDAELWRSTGSDPGPEKDIVGGVRYYVGSDESSQDRDTGGDGDDLLFESEGESKNTVEDAGPEEPNGPTSTGDDPGGAHAGGDGEGSEAQRPPLSVHGIGVRSVAAANPNNTVTFAAQATAANNTDSLLDVVVEIQGVDSEGFERAAVRISGKLSPGETRTLTNRAAAVPEEYGQVAAWQVKDWSVGQVGVMFDSAGESV